jgi:protein gp37
MARKTEMEWTGATWNPVTGCTKISTGCRNCYAERMSKRLAGRYGYDKENPFKVTLHPNRLNQPLKWRKPNSIFVCSMGDLFHKEVPDDYIIRIFDVMRACPRHTFQILTKRSERLSQIHPITGGWPPNVWAGVTVEAAENKNRIGHLRKAPAKVRYLCCEPLLGFLGPLPLSGIHWVIAGGESGWGARKLHHDWIADLRDQCVAQNTPLYFKQWGGIRKKLNGRLLDGKEWCQYPRVV